MLNLEIKDINFHLNFLRSKVTKIENKLFDNLSENLVTAFFNFARNKIGNHNQATKYKFIKKFNDLCCNTRIISFFNMNYNMVKWLINVSNKLISDPIQRFLSLGENLCGISPSSSVLLLSLSVTPTCIQRRHQRYPPILLYFSTPSPLSFFTMGTAISSLHTAILPLSIPCYRTSIFTPLTSSFHISIPRL